jgi:hypothetical protein
MVDLDDVVVEIASKLGEEARYLQVPSGAIFCWRGMQL